MLSDKKVVESIGISNSLSNTLFKQIDRVAAANSNHEIVTCFKGAIYDLAEKNTEFGPQSQQCQIRKQLHKEIARHPRNGEFHLTQYFQQFCV